jgi:hypothetical protein
MDGRWLRMRAQLFFIAYSLLYWISKKKSRSERLDKTLSEFVNNQSDCFVPLRLFLS